MSREQAQNIIRDIEKRGFRAYLVGGCVRDLLLGRMPEDWDIASSARPEQIMEIFGAQALPTGLKHGTVTVKTWDGAYEITTFRTDGGYSDGRHPDAVAYTKTIEEDLSRRDLTINAMAISSSGRLVDPFDGAGDLARRVIRCVGKAERRFSEDALRILRAIRFASVLDFSVEEATRQAIHKQAALLKKIAAERILVEMNKLLCGTGCREVLLSYPDVLGVFMPELLPCVGFDQKNIHHCYDLYTHITYAVATIAPEPVLRWTMLLHDIGKVDTFTVDAAGSGHFYGHPQRSAAMAEEICRRMRMRNADREEIVKLIRWHDRDIPVTEKGIGSAGETGRQSGAGGAVPLGRRKNNRGGGDPAGIAAKKELPAAEGSGHKRTRSAGQGLCRPRGRSSLAKSAANGHRRGNRKQQRGTSVGAAGEEVIISTGEDSRRPAAA